MRKGKTLLTTLLVLAVIFFALRFTYLALKYSEGNKKGPPSQCYSQSIIESKKNNVFQFEDTVNKPTLIFEKSFKCVIKNSWVENKYISQPLVFGTSPIEKINNAYQLLIAIKIDKNANKRSKYHYFIGGYPLDTIIHFDFENNLDTIKVPIYRSKTDEFLLIDDEKAFDTLIFTKKLSQ